MNTPITQFPFEYSESSKAKTPSKLTFQGLPKFRPDEFELRSDFNRNDQLNSRILQSAGLRTIDYLA
jgi:hypothetical protein